MLLKNDQIDVNIKEDNGGYTALIISAYHNNTECVKLLLENDKIDVGAKGTNGYTALMMAEANDSTECVKLLS